MTALALALAAALLAPAGDAAFPPARPVVPFVEIGDIGCHWTMHGAGEKWIRGGLGQGDDDPVITLVDNAFDRWSDSDEHLIEVSAGDPARRAPANAWAGNAGGQTPGTIGFYLDAALRQLIGGASSLQIWKDGTPVYNTALAAMPSAAELDACVRPPSEGHGDSE